MGLATFKGKASRGLKAERTLVREHFNLRDNTAIGRVKAHGWPVYSMSMLLPILFAASGRRQRLNSFALIFSLNAEKNGN